MFCAGVSADIRGVGVGGGFRRRQLASPPRYATPAQMRGTLGLCPSLCTLTLTHALFAPAPSLPPARSLVWRFELPLSNPRLKISAWNKDLVGTVDDTIGEYVRYHSIASRAHDASLFLSPCASVGRVVFWGLCAALCAALLPVKPPALLSRPDSAKHTALKALVSPHAPRRHFIPADGVPLEEVRRPHVPPRL